MENLLGHAEVAPSQRLFLPCFMVKGRLDLKLVAARSSIDLR